MVVRVFSAMGVHPRVFPAPKWLFALALTMLRIMPRYQNWSMTMVDRMNCDLVFDHTDAKADFDFSPQRFQLLDVDCTENTEPFWRFYYI